MHSATVETQNSKISQQIKELVGEFGAFIEADDGESVEIESIIINRISAQKVKEGTYPFTNLFRLLIFLLYGHGIKHC